MPTFPTGSYLFDALSLKYPLNLVYLYYFPLSASLLHTIGIAERDKQIPELEGFPQQPVEPGLPLAEWIAWVVWVRSR